MTYLLRSCWRPHVMSSWGEPWNLLIQEGAPDSPISPVLSHRYDLFCTCAIIKLHSMALLKDGTKNYWTNYGENSHECWATGLGSKRDENQPKLFCRSSTRYSKIQMSLFLYNLTPTLEQKHSKNVHTVFVPHIIHTVSLHLAPSTKINQSIIHILTPEFWISFVKNVILSVSVLSCTFTREWIIH